MRQLSALGWLSSGGWIALSILCVATLVCGAFGLLKNQHWRKTGTE
jgi:hypothetical protein